MSALDVIPLASAKDWLRVDFNDEDAKITELIKTAVEWVEKYTGKYLWRRNITYKVQPQDRCNRYVVISAAPDLAIVSVNGITTDLPELNGDRLPIDLAAQTIVYAAGYEGVDDIPAPIITAAKKFMALQYEEAIDGQDEQRSEIERLLDPYREFTWF